MLLPSSSTMGHSTTALQICCCRCGRYLHEALWLILSEQHHYISFGNITDGMRLKTHGSLCTHFWQHCLFCPRTHLQPMLDARRRWYACRGSNYYWFWDEKTSQKTWQRPREREIMDERQWSSGSAATFSSYSPASGVPEGRVLPKGCWKLFNIYLVWLTHLSAAVPDARGLTPIPEIPQSGEWKECPVCHGSFSVTSP